MKLILELCDAALKLGPQEDLLSCDWFELAVSQE